MLSFDFSLSVNIHLHLITFLIAQNKVGKYVILFLYHIWVTSIRIYFKFNFVPLLLPITKDGMRVYFVYKFNADIIQNLN